MNDYRQQCTLFGACMPTSDQTDLKNLMHNLISITLFVVGFFLHQIKIVRIFFCYRTLPYGGVCV